jgi:dephospho-CoA kinase/inosine/xanthosine triphosphate pyrophosphatase family protein
MIEIIFFTSSPVKLAHARYLCRDYDVQITGFKEKTFGANYTEPRIYDREQLIEESYQDALQRWKKTIASSEDRLFFIEDTSVAIDALSTEQETPGLDVKYWMAETDFAALDAQLKVSGNNRRATVRSDLVLHLTPKLRSTAQDKSYLCFSSNIVGCIVDNEQLFDTNPMYPWLDNKTFNKWFVPDGCSQPISMLPIAEADQHDFRAQAFRSMLAFLEQHKIIGRRTVPVIQKYLEIGEPLFVICGPSCAGKTTLAGYLAEQYGYYHIEASDFMYLSYYQRHGVASSVNIGDFAEQALRDQPEIVAEQILHNIQENKARAVVVTGFRSPLEVDWFQRYYMDGYPIVAVYVAADAALRFERSVIRQRDDEAANRERFNQRDAQQAAMGLEELARRFLPDRLENNGSLEHFFNGFETRYVQNQQRSYMADNAGYLTAGKLESLILLTLLEKWSSQEYFTTTEIAHLLNQTLDGKPKSKNNVSRYFNQRFYPYFEIKLIDGKRKYRLSNTGYGKARRLR